MLGNISTTAIPSRYPNSIAHYTFLLSEVFFHFIELLKHSLEAFAPKL